MVGLRSQDLMTGKGKFTGFNDCIGKSTGFNDWEG